MMPAFLRARRWFRGKGRPIRLAEIFEIVRLPKSGGYLLLIRVEFGDGEPEIYTLPLAVARGDAAEPERVPERELMQFLQAPDGSMGFLHSGLEDRAYCDELLSGILRRKRFTGERGELVAAHTRAFRALWGPEHPALEPALSEAYWDNTTVFFGDRFAFKMLRKLEDGPNPEQEIGAMLTEEKFPHAAPLAGTIEYRGADGGRMLAALLHGFVRQGSDAYLYTLHSLGLFFEHALARGAAGPLEAAPSDLTHELMAFLIWNSCACWQRAPPRCTWRWLRAAKTRPLLRLSPTRISTGMDSITACWRGWDAP